MKHFTRLLAIVLSISLSFDLLKAQDMEVAAKEKTGKVKFMDHLSVSVEAGTVGFGLEVATTLHPNFMLRAGFSMLPLSQNIDAKVYFYGADDHFNDIVKDNPQIEQALRKRGLPINSKEIPNEVKIKDKLKMYNGKILVDYYPRAKKRFHVTAGVYLGGRNFETFTGQMPSEYMEAVHVMNTFLPEDEQFMPAIWDGDWLILNYLVEASPSGKVNYAWRVNPVKPYIGIGGGRAVPKKRIGCQFDLGVMFQGKAKMSSKYYAENLFENLGILGFTSVLPVISIRLVGRIF